MLRAYYSLLSAVIGIPQSLVWIVYACVRPGVTYAAMGDRPICQTGSSLFCLCLCLLVPVHTQCTL